MKFARPLLFTLVTLLVLAATALAVALTPAFQRWAVLRLAAQQPGFTLRLDRLAAGFSHVEVQGLRVVQSGVVVQLGRLEADYALWPLLFQGRLEISAVKTADVVIDVSRLARGTTEAVAGGATTAVPGVLARLELPFALVLGECQIKGQVLLPGGSAPAPIPVDFQISGGQFAPGQEGNLQVNATVNNPRPHAPVTQLKARLNLRATQTGEHTFSQINLVAVVDAEGETMTAPNQLKIATQLSREAEGEHYRVSVDTLTRGTTENLLTLQAALATGAEAYTGQWSLKARTAQVQSYFLGGTLPEFSAHGSGRFSVAPGRQAFDCQGDWQADVSRLEAIEPAWRALGAVKINSRFDVAIAGEVASFRQLEITVAGAEPVLELRMAPAVEFNPAKRRLQVGGSSTGEVLTLKVLGLPLAWVRPFVQAVDVSGGKITGEWVVTTAQERMRLRSTQPWQIDGLTVVQAGQPLLSDARLQASLEAELTDHDLHASLNPFTLKTGAGDSLTAEATVSFPLGKNPPISASVRYQADLPKLLAPWLPVGRVQANGAGELTLTGGELAVKTLETTMRDASGTEVLGVAALRPFTANLNTLTVTTGEKAPTDLLRLKLGRIALSALPLTEPGTILDGALENAEFLLSAEADRFTLRALQPLKLSGIGLTQAGQPALTGLGIEFMPRVEIGAKTAVRFQSGDITVRTAQGATLATMKGEADGSPSAGWRGAATFQLEIPSLGTQPMFAGAQSVSAGRASGEVRVAWHHTSQVEARLTLNGLADQASGQTLPVANLSFQGTVDQAGKISIQAPLLLDQGGRRSDLNVALALTPTGHRYELAGQVSGEQLELGDLLAVASVFQPASPEAAPSTAVTVSPKPTVEADTAPAWARFTGQLGLDVKAIRQGEEWAMTGLTGRLSIKPARVALEKLEAAFGEKGRLAAQGEVTFQPGAQPYQLGGKFSVTEFDAGKLFKALEPAKPATVEGLFTVNGDFAGCGETLDRLLERTQGQFALTSRQGIFRGLQRTTSKVSKTTKAVELGASVLGSLFGSDKVTKAAEKVAGAAYFVDQLAQELGEIKYDQLSVKMTRDATLNLKLEDISLVAPEIRLIGQGTVTHVEDKPLLEQPLNASFTLASRGKVEQLLGKLSWNDGTRDELGFAKTKEPLTVTGTLTKPNPTAFFTKLAAMKLSDYLNGEN